MFVGVRPKYVPLPLGRAGVREKTVGGLYHTPSRVIIADDLVVKDNAKDFYYPESAY